MGDGGSFGDWFLDEFGLPAYRYTCNQWLDPKAEHFTTSGPSRDHWHQMGNDRVNALAHNDGSVEVLDSSRGLQWLCHRDPKRRQWGGGIAIIQEEKNDSATWTDLFFERNRSHEPRRVFGVGYCRKTTRRNGLTLDHAVFPPFSDDPVVISELVVKNDTRATKTFILYDYWGIDIRSIIPALIYFDHKRKTFSKGKLLNLIGNLWKLISHSLHIAPEQKRDRFSSKFSYRAAYLPDLRAGILRPVFRGRGRPPRNQPATRNYYPKLVFLSALDALPTRVIFSTDELVQRGGRLDNRELLSGSIVTTKDSPCLCLGSYISLKPGETRRVTFLLGYAQEGRIPRIIRKYGSQSDSAIGAFPLLKTSADEWKRKLVYFTSDRKTLDWVTREAKWHSSYLRGAALFDEYFENHLLPQGGAYNYLHGLQGAPRDFILFTVPMIYLEPRLAREMLEYTLRMMTPDGKIPYATYGFGMEGGALVHKSPSDLPLFLLWGLSEYLFATRDFEFLKKRLPFYPRGSGASSTVYERIKRSVDYIINEVGLGEHGLIRVGDGDWNDGISTMVKNRGKFIKKGESMFNSALALYILPRLSLLFERQGDKTLSEKTMLLRHGLQQACLRSWNGKWFYRGWDGSGHPIGNQSIFLEPLTWLLISGTLPKSIAEQLISGISSILDDPSPFGQYLVYPSVPTLFDYLQKGWDVNGGTWFAMDFLLSWGYSKYDVRKAWRAFTKNSMKHHAELYPDIWYGIWSGPDAFNASYAHRPGETYYHLATPTTDFPVMNLNLHANFLAALIKMAGVEPTIDGLTLEPSLPFGKFSLQTPILGIKVSDGSIEGSYKRQASGEFVLRVRLPRHWKEMDCYLDGKKTACEIDRNLSIAKVRVETEAETFSFKFERHVE